jgi:RNA polymerase sigma-70 factor (ECF subfamily)
VSDTDEQLLDGLRRGDDDAFERLFLRHYNQVYRVLYSLVGGREQAEDLAQETFLTLYRHPPTIDLGATLIGWLCRVTLNRVYRANNRLKFIENPVWKVSSLVFSPESAQASSSDISPNHCVSLPNSATPAQVLRIEAV